MSLVAAAHLPGPHTLCLLVTSDTCISRPNNQSVVQFSRNLLRALDNSPEPVIGSCLAADTHASVGRSGSSVEYRYWEIWSQSQPPLPMVYLPIGWSAHFWRARHDVVDLRPKQALQNIDWVRGQPLKRLHICQGGSG